MAGAYERIFVRSDRIRKRLANDSKASDLILSLMEEGNPVLNAFHVETVDGEKK